jgi:CRISPR-associated protein Cmr5
MLTKTPKPSLDQQRAAYAWKKVQGYDSDYTKLAKGAPALIMNNGLMQTLAFYADKDKNHHRALNQHLIDWLATYLTGKEVSNLPFKAMMDALQNADSQKYRKATEETLALLRWIRQFAAINQ